MKSPFQPSAGWRRAVGAVAPDTGSAASTAAPGLQAIPRIGLALSSGGARGLAHVGVLQVLEEQRIPVCALAGCSMGAYVGGLWAAGLSGETLAARAAEIKDRKALRRLLDFAIPPARGLVHGERLRQHLERDLRGVKIEELRMQTLIVATDLNTLHAHVFDSGNLARAIHASAAIPGVCVPVELDGRLYTDGGASEPLPVTLLRDHFHVDHVIAVNVMPLPEEAFASTASAETRKRGGLGRLLSRLLHPINLFADGNVLDTFRRALMAAQLRLIAKESDRADVLIQPRFGRSTWYDFENHASYIAAGRRAALEAMPAIQRLISHQTTDSDHETVFPYAPVGIDAA